MKSCKIKVWCWTDGRLLHSSEMDGSINPTTEQQNPLSCSYTFQPSSSECYYSLLAVTDVNTFASLSSRSLKPVKLKAAALMQMIDSWADESWELLQQQQGACRDKTSTWCESDAANDRSTFNFKWCSLTALKVKVQVKVRLETQKVV